MSDLLERMAEALRREHEGNKDALASLMERGIYDGVDDDAKRQMDEVDALLAEYDRDRKRLVLLRFENARNIEGDGKTARFFVMHDGGFGLFRGVYLEDGDYAYAVLPPLPGPEAFKNEEQS